MAVHSRHLLRIAVAASMAGAPARAQHAGHESMPASRADSAWTLHVMAQGVPLVTRADPTVGSAVLSEAALTQTVLMAHAGWWRDHAMLDATLDAEGLTMRRGEQPRASVSSCSNTRRWRRWEA